METTEQTLEYLREILPYFAVLMAAGAAAFAYLGILAFTHIKARLILEFYRDLGKQIQKDEAAVRAGNEVAHLARFQELQGSLRDLLERERILAKPPKK